MFFIFKISRKGIESIIQQIMFNRMNNRQRSQGGSVQVTGR